MTTEKISSLLRQVQERPRCPDWGAKVQSVAETIWNSSAYESTSATIIQALIGLLQQDDAFALARLVIPDFRSANPTSDGFRQTIIDQTRDVRLKALRIETTTQADIDTPSYRQEKEVYAEAEMYRASLLLHGTAAFEGADVEEILEWLEKRPNKSRNSKTMPNKS